jgi:hypothetical protein
MLERREMLADGLRCLAQVLPAMIATAGSLGFLFRRPVGADIDNRPACFPSQIEEMAQQTSTHCQRRTKDGNNPP